MIKLSDYVMNFIAGLGVKDIFLFSGGGAMHLVDSVGKCESLNYVCVLHEQAASIAMESYSQYTGNLGVALVTTGPGGTNAITGLAAAWIDSIPCLVISGQVKRDDLKGHTGVRQFGGQEVDIVNIVSSLTKYAVTILDPLSIRYHLEKAIYLSKNGRPGPVWLDIPLDVQAAMIDEALLHCYDPSEDMIESTSNILTEQVKSAIDIIRNAKRPVILAGNGIRLAGALDDFYEMINLLQLPVLTTWKAADFLSEDSSLFVGRPGAIGQRGANFAQQNADCIITIGARLDLAQTGYRHEHFAPVAKKIFIDIDSCELGKMRTAVDVAICSDAGDFLKEFLYQWKAAAYKELSIASWWAQCCEWKNSYPVVLDSYRKREVDGIDTYVFVDTLAKVMQEHSILVPGSSGACAEITLQAFKVKKGQRIINSPGLGAMGFGLPASIGVCIASGNKTVVTIDGDGGIQLNIQELETIKRLQLPIKIFVLNNHGYGSIRITQQNYFNCHYVGCEATSGLTLPDITNIAKAYDLKSCRITKQENLEEQLLAVLNCSGPVICEVLTPVEQLTMPKLASKKNEDGSMESKPLEDLWPFLDEQELKKNIIHMKG